MKQLISISDIGAIRVYDIPLMADIGYAKHILRNYAQEETKAGLYVKKIPSSNLPNMDLFFSINSENKINSIRITNCCLSQKECSIAYNFFRKEFSSFNVVSKNKSENTQSLLLSNLLHRVSLFKQNGLGNDKTKFPFVLDIDGKLIESNPIGKESIEKQKNESIKSLYFDESNYNSRKNECTRTKINPYKVIKIIIAILALALFFLYIQNGRYVVSKLLVIDKWTGEAERIQVK